MEKAPPTPKEGTDKLSAATSRECEANESDGSILGSKSKLLYFATELLFVELSEIYCPARIFILICNES